MSFKEFYWIKEQAFNPSKDYFHVCKDDDISSISQKGLLIQVGDRSSQLNEEPGIFLFRSVDSPYDAVMNWLGDEYDESVVLSILKVSLPANFPLEVVPNSFEVISRTDIPPSFIKIEKRNI